MGEKGKHESVLFLQPPHEWYDKSSNNHQSTIPPRETLKWIHRKDDFDRWTRAPPLPRSVSAHWRSENETTSFHEEAVRAEGLSTIPSESRSGTSKGKPISNTHRLPNILC